MRVALSSASACVPRAQSRFPCFVQQLAYVGSRTGHRRWMFQYAGLSSLQPEHTSIVALRCAKVDKSRVRRKDNKLEHHKAVNPLAVVHLPNADSLIEKAASPNASLHLEWALSCQKMHPQHLLLYWDHETARRLLEMVGPLNCSSWGSRNHHLAPQTQPLCHCSTTRSFCRRLTSFPSTCKRPTPCAILYCTIWEAST